VAQYIDQATGWTTGFQFPAGAMMEFFSSPPLPDRLWGSSRLLAEGYRRLLPRK